MGRGRGSFARVAARSTCREINRRNRYRSSNTIDTNDSDDEETSIVAIILTIIIIIAIIVMAIPIIGGIISFCSETGIFGIAIVFFIIAFIKALFG